MVPSFQDRFIKISYGRNFISSPSFQTNCTKSSDEFIIYLNDTNQTNTIFEYHAKDEDLTYKLENTPGMDYKVIKFEPTVQLLYSSMNSISNFKLNINVKHF